MCGSILYKLQSYCLRLFGNLICVLKLFITKIIRSCLLCFSRYRNQIVTKPSIFFAVLHQPVYYSFFVSATMLRLMAIPVPILTKYYHGSSGYSLKAACIPCSLSFLALAFTFNWRKPNNKTDPWYLLFQDGLLVCCSSDLFMRQF